MYAEQMIPILPARDLHETRAFYERLGFEIRYWSLDSKEGYAILIRGGVTLHLFSHPALRPDENYAGCYWKVPDADSLYSEFQKLGFAAAEGMPRLIAIEDKPWGMREFAFLDPSGNLVRVGHEL